MAPWGSPMRGCPSAYSREVGHTDGGPTMDSSQLTRRTFLYGSALVAGAAALSACSPGGGGQAPEADPTGGPRLRRRRFGHRSAAQAGGVPAVADAGGQDPARRSRSGCPRTRTSSRTSWVAAGQVRRHAQHERLLHHRRGQGRLRPRVLLRPLPAALPQRRQGRRARAWWSRGSPTTTRRSGPSTSARA